MNRRKRYTISVDRKQLFGGHHVIVISDGTHEDITFELTFKGSVVSAVIGQEEAVAKVAIYDKTDRSYLEEKGVVKNSLYELSETAAGILKDNPHYHLLNNNCQNFCNKFLGTYNLPTYTTDAENVKGAATVVEAIIPAAYSLLSASQQQK